MIKSFIETLVGSIGGMKGSIALAGLILIGIVLIVYMLYGVYKLVRFTLRLRVHEFALLMLAIGMALIAVAIVLP